MVNIRICPGSAEVAWEALGLFSSVRVDPGTWLEPVRVRDLTEDEVVFAKEFFAEYGCIVEKD